MKLLVLCAMLMLLFAGCTGNQDKVGPSDSEHSTVKVPQAMPEKTQNKAVAEFTIASPSEGALVAAGDVIVTLGVKNFRIGEVGGIARANEGHFHLFLDDGTYILCPSTTCTIQNVPSGDHRIMVIAHNNDHSGYAGVAPKTVKIKAVAPAAFEIAAPTKGGVANSPKVTVRLRLDNFKIGEVGGINKPNEGNFHLYLDEGDYVLCLSSTCEVNGVSPGTHTLKVQAFNNDQSPYEGIDTQTVTFVAMRAQPA